MSLSAVDRARNDTLVRKAEGSWYDRIATLFGVGRPHYVTVNRHRDGLRANAWGPRGTPGAVHRYLEATLRANETVVSVTRATGSPARITAAAGSPFIAAHRNRLILIGGAVYRSKDGTATYLDLDTVATSRWTGAAWAADDTVDARILPFTMLNPAGMQRFPEGAVVPYGTPCEVAVELRASTYYTRRSFLLTDAEDVAQANDRETGQPFGGQILADETKVGDRTAGPHPLFLAGGAAPSLAVALDALLAAGIHPRFGVE